MKTLKRNASRPQVVILCGGMGTRLREETEYKPKPLVTIGSMPVLWHIMKLYAHHGFKDFVLCLGYKGAMIKEFFMNLRWMSHDFELDLKSRKERILDGSEDGYDWKIVFADTGAETNTGGRVWAARKYITSENFFLTYSDGLANVDIRDLYAFHRKMGRAATLTAVHPMSSFGILEFKKGIAESFKEKPRLEGAVNGGFFVFNRRVFDYLDARCVLEEEPLRRLSRDRQLAVYEHKDFWMCMDTFKEVERLNRMWKENVRPWMVWKSKSAR